MRSLSLYHYFVGIASIAVKITSRDAQVRVKQFIYVTGSGKRDIFAQTMIFQYKRCYSKRHNIIYYLKNFFFGLTVSTTLCLHSHQILATECPSNWSSVLLKDCYLNLPLQSKNVVKRGQAGRRIRLKKSDRVFFQSLT